MTSWLLTLPLLTPFATAVVLVLGPRTPRVANAIGVVGAGLLLAAALALFVTVLEHGTQAAQMGAWPAPFGITLVADTLSAIMVLVAGVMGLAVAVYATAEIDEDRLRFGFFALFHVLLGGVMGAFLTGDLFNLYVWFEVLLIAAFGLLVLGGEPAQVDGAVKYVALNLVSTILLLLGIALLYGMAGTLNLADLHLRLQGHPDPTAISAVATVLLVALGIKAAAFPLFFWLPASYHTPPVAVTAIFSALLTKVGVYALIRLFTLVFTGDVGFTHGIILVSGVLTMVVGVLGAAAQNEVRRILAVHIVSQIGYMLAGLALLTPVALAGAVFYLVHNIVVKALLFLLAGIMRFAGGSFELARLGGLWRRHPWLALLFLIAAFSLAGFPPLSGFWGKLALIRAGLEAEVLLVVVAALATSILTIFSMTKIWSEAFWKDAPPGAGQAIAPAGSRLALILPVLALVALALAMGLGAGPFLALTERAAGELLDPSAYVAAVLGPERLAEGSRP